MQIEPHGVDIEPSSHADDRDRLVDAAERPATMDGDAVAGSESRVGQAIGVRQAIGQDVDALDARALPQTLNDVPRVFAQRAAAWRIRADERDAQSSHSRASISLSTAHRRSKSSP